MIGAIGDLHIGALDKWIADLHEKQLATLSGVLNAMESRGIQHVILLGDLFDNAYPSQLLVRRFLDVLASKKGLFYHIIPGNHDMESTDQHSLMLIEWLGKHERFNGRVYVNPTTVKIEGHKYWMCPHPFTLPAPEKVALSIGHFAWAGAKRDNGSSSPKGSTPAGRWVMGDFHTHQVGKRFIYAGSLTQISFEEKGPKGYLHIDGDDVEFVPFKPAYRLERKIIKDAADLKALNTGTYYAVQFPSALKLPEGWQERHPNIIHHGYLDGKVKADKVETSRFFISNDPLDGLRDWLRARKVLDKPKRIEALKMARQLTRKGA